MHTRRRFIRRAVGASLAAAALASPAASYARILGANDRLRVAFMGLGGRGKLLLQDFIDGANVSVASLCDVDSQRIDEAQTLLADNGLPPAPGDADVRRALDGADADVLVVATPDHWHTPAAVMALARGTHVYLEKPVSHNPREGELLVDAQGRYGGIVQVGNQQRSSLETRELIDRIHRGELGDVYYIYTWYANNRGTIGNGTRVPVPDWLDWDLWQGPAPRRDYQDNVVHYNWHWFWRWGTGETCNNAMHELDLARWAIRADYPDEVGVDASRQFFRDDDWEMYDTMLARYRFGDVEVAWEGHSCNSLPRFGRGRGTAFYGRKGSAIVDRNGYEMYDPDGQRIGERLAPAESETTGTGGGGPLNRLHIDNFLDVVRGGNVKLHSPVSDGHKSTLLCHLANIAYRTGETLACDPDTGRPSNDAAREFWSRDYEEGWAPESWTA